ncbi:putative baseplate assembly protein [Cellulomonas sp. NPDC055163]
MALISPILDDRSQAQLAEELRRRIPVYVPAWTDHNPTDPGIALLELFAYLGESLLYRFNQIPETTYVEFLRLLGVQPRGARPASVLVAAETDEPQGVQVLRGSEAAAGDVSFETDDELYAWPLEAVGAGKTPVPDAQIARERRLDAISRPDVPKDRKPVFYHTALTPEDPTAPDVVPVDVSEQVDRRLWVALLARDTTDLAALGGRILFLGVAFDEQLARSRPLDKVLPDPTEKFRSKVLTEDPPPTVWELWTGVPASPTESPFRSLAVIGDTTRGMVTTGVVKLELPSPFPARLPAAGGLADSPPPIDDEETATKVVAWLRVGRPATPDIGDTIGRVLWVGTNCVAATQSRTPSPELLGSGTGDSDQRYPLTHSPVLADSVKVQVEESGRWVDWEEVESFSASTAADRHFVVDHDHGAVVFGTARVPQLGERIRVPSYRYGGGARGNVPAKAVTAFPQNGGISKASNPLPAAGGTDRVNLAAALDAIPGAVQRNDRAVVADDYRALAEEVSGVARAEVLSLFHPDTPSVEAAGVTSVVVLPDRDVRNPDAPQPDVGLLRRVAAYLDVRRLLTAELYVIPPEYVRLAVSVGVQVRDGYPVDAVRRWVEQILRQYLSAVPPQGPDGSGWPLGRAVRAAELEAVAVQVEGVEYALGTRLATLDPAPTERNLVALTKWQVPEIAAVTVVTGPPTDPTVPATTPPSDTVPVPLPVEVC